MKHIGICLLMMGTLLAARGEVIAQDSVIIVNGVPLSYQEQTQYGITLPPGRYWYDHMSGFWGQEGGPYVDQYYANLPVGGPLQADASRGNTGVLINGRQIHLSEYYELHNMCGQVPPGRYWLNANLIGGVEHGPPAFNLSNPGCQLTPPANSGGDDEFTERDFLEFCAENGGCYY